MFELLRSVFDISLFIIGFGFLVVIHELGHFLAARWAGVRIHQFAIGMGPAVCSFRKGIGFRPGSTRAEVHKRLREAGMAVDRQPIENLDPPPGVSATEYRLNWLPLGGYVKMRGQEDLHPEAVSDNDDSFTALAPGKRLIIMSAGVLANLALGAILFIIVFMAGLRASPPVIGDVLNGSAAETAIPLNGNRAGVMRPGLLPGDRILSIGDRETMSFKDIFAGAAMARRGQPLRISVDRPGVEDTLLFEIKPTENRRTRFQELGVFPLASTTLRPAPASEDEQRIYRELLDQAGLIGVMPGMTLVKVNGEPVSALWPLTNALRNSDSQPVAVRFTSGDGQSVDASVRPRPRFETAVVQPSIGDPIEVTHLLGLAPPMRVGAVQPRAKRFGLRQGDIIARIGEIDWPSASVGIEAIRRHAGRRIDLVVLRDNQYISISAVPSGQGAIGFSVTEQMDQGVIVTQPVLAQSLAAAGGDDANDDDAKSAAARRRPFAASSLDLPPGSIIIKVGDTAVNSYAELRAALRSFVKNAPTTEEGVEVPLTVRYPIGDTFNTGPTDQTLWSLSASDVKELLSLGWASPVSAYFFEPAQIRLKADGPIEALTMGVAETHRMVVMTYLTLLRLFEGSVKIEHLKGPVGIVQLGSEVTRQGFIDMLFFLAVLSVNLAVLNFLPLPIFDGGHAVFLLIEIATGRPVSIAVQNVATIIGLALIGVVFLIITYNDLIGLFT